MPERMFGIVASKNLSKVVFREYIESKSIRRFSLMHHATSPAISPIR